MSPLSSGSVYVLRHGETEWSRDRRHTGHSDIPLTARGKRQAAATAPLLADRHGDQPWSLVLTSPLSRAADTAVIAGFPAAAADARLAEWDYGYYDGLTTAQIRRQRPGWVLWRDGCPHGEDAEQVGARVDALLAERVRPAVAGGDVLLIAHSHLLRILTARWLGLSPPDGRLLVLDPAGVGVLGEEHGGPALHGWNISGAPC